MNIARSVNRCSLTSWMFAETYRYSLHSSLKFVVVAVFFFFAFRTVRASFNMELEIFVKQKDFEKYK